MREFWSLTVSDAKNDIFTLIDAGADGYLLKDTEPDVLLEQIKRIAQGEVILSDSIKNLLLERKHTVDPMDSLTDREMDVTFNRDRFIQQTNCRSAFHFWRNS